MILSKEEKLKAFEILENLDSFWDNSKEEIFNAVTVLTEYTNYLEDRLASAEAIHEYDVKMIDEVKGENIKLNKTIDEMAKSFTKTGTCPNEKFEADLDCEHRCSDDNELITECWKKYFEKR